MVCLISIFSLVQAAAPMVNMTVTNAEVRDVLTALASVGQVSIVADDSVTGKVTIQLQNIPFETALELVTKTKGLTYQRIGEVIVVAAADKMSKSFGTVQIIKLNYANAEEVRKSLAIVVPDDRLKVDTATNSLVFMGSPGETEQIRTSLKELDIPFQQVSLEAQVVAMNKNASKDLGVDWSWSETPTYPEYEPADSTTTINPDGTKTTTSSSHDTYTRTENSGTIRFGRSPLGIPYEFYYKAKISALISNGNAKILAKPKITAINGKEAKILIGDRIPVLSEKTENGKTTSTIEYIDAGIKLNFTPQINADGQITAKVHTEVSTPTLVPEMKAYRITTREAETEVRMKDGETMVIGGLIGSEESGGKNKVPFLGDLPILGKLFQSTHTSKNETEVVIFLTAQTVK
jgi:type IV pilus secretin PilQ/predicted competence protein